MRRSSRPIWQVILLSVVAVLLLNALAGTPSSLVERLLHIRRVPAWWPFVLAAVVGIGLGGFITRGPRPAAEEGGAQGAKRRTAPAKRGRHAVPRHIRRERARQEMRQRRIDDAALEAAQVVREAEAARRREAEAAAVPTGVVAKLRHRLRRGLRP